MKPFIIFLSCILIFACKSNEATQPMIMSQTDQVINPDTKKELAKKLNDKNHSNPTQSNHPEIVESEAAFAQYNIKGKNSKHSKYCASRFYNKEQESYAKINENDFTNPIQNPLSTFSIDVDRASYSNMRRYIQMGQLPPKDAIRVEEMINYFNYNYHTPTDEKPLAEHHHLTTCPWNSEHQLLHIGLQAKKIKAAALPTSNFVFLIDVSGSMQNDEKLPLLIKSFRLLVNNLRDDDRVAIVTYAGSAGVILESTAAKNKTKIIDALEKLQSGGSTAGAAGIKTAYQIAEANFVKEGNNRVILATDGDFNVGVNSNEDLEDLIVEKRASGVYLSILGFGMGNYKDDKMQTLAGKGNGNHAYIDNLQEAHKILISEFGGTLFSVAKDVKFQIEFNPSAVSAYRLVGYENRMLNDEDFNDDRKDAGEIGAGHTVTAIYEIIPHGAKSNFSKTIDDLKYQKNPKKNLSKKSDELATIKIRYKNLNESKSKKIVSTVSNNLSKSNDDVNFAIAVAHFGLILRKSELVERHNLEQVIALAENSLSYDPEGYRAEFVRLVKTTKELELISE